MNEKAAQAVYNFFHTCYDKRNEYRMSPDEGKADPAMKNKMKGTENIWDEELN